MNNKMLNSLIAGIFIVILAGGYGDKGSGSMPAASAVASAAPQTEKADYSSYLTVEEVQSITGRSDLKLKSFDSKKSGEANDLTYSTTEGQIILAVQVLRGRDYEMFYKDFRCQDYKGMEYAFWGPKTATPENPPNQLWFRIGDTLIFIESINDGNKKSDWDAEMMEKVAKIIASRL